MELGKSTSHRISALVFLGSTILTTYILNSIAFSDILALTGGLFTGIITTGIWLEVSYRYLIKEATAPLDKIIEKI